MITCTANNLWYTRAKSTSQLNEDVDVTTTPLHIEYMYKQPLWCPTKEGSVWVFFASFWVGGGGEGVIILWKGKRQAKIMIIFKFWMLFA